MEMEIVLRTKINGYDSIMTEDVEEKLFTMSCLERGGAIIVGKTKEDCLEKFKEAMNLAVAVKKLMTFSETGHF